MKKFAAVLAMAAGAAVIPVAVAPAAQADVCAGAGARHFAIGGCSNVAADEAAVAIEAQHIPYVPGELPCYTVEGVAYFTPPGQPC